MGAIYSVVRSKIAKNHAVSLPKIVRDKLGIKPDADTGSYDTTELGYFEDGGKIYIAAVKAGSESGLL